MSSYGCCICMKSIEDKFNWEELVLPQNEDDEDSEIYSDENTGHGFHVANGSRLTDADARILGQVQSYDRLTTNSHETPLSKFDQTSSEFLDVESNHPNWSAIVSTPCGHLYHLGCIHSWMDHLEKRGWEQTCPYCRHVIYNSMELIPIYPVSFKEYESEDDCSSKESENKTLYDTKDEISGAAQIKAIAVLETPPKKDPYFNGIFWLSVLMVAFVLLLYSGYVFSCLEILETEDSEENEFDPLFGTAWTVLVLISMLVAVTTDLFQLYK